MQTKELTELVDLALTVVDVVSGVTADSKVDLMDLGQLMKLIPVLQPGFDGIDQIPAELEDLDEAEVLALVTHVMVKLTIQDEHAKKVVAASLKVLSAGFGLYQAIKS